MKAFNLAQTALAVRLWLTRFGWTNSVVGVLLLLGASAWLWAIPQLKQQAVSAHVALAAAQKSFTSALPVAIVPPLPPAQQRLQQFYDVLGESRYAEQQVKTLFALAAKNGLSINQAEYKFATNKDGLFHTYTISLPVKGQYGAIRPFCEQILLAVPFASLDEINFKRDAVNNPNLEAKLRFTMHLDNAHGMPGTFGSDNPPGGDL